MLFPFTSKGVQDKLSKLYVLEDADLFLQADAIERNFKSWIKDSFSLSSEQVDFLNHINDQATDYFGQQCATCFRHRLPIELIYPQPNPGYAKWPEATNDIIISADNAGNIQASGSLTFTMVYRDHKS